MPNQLGDIFLGVTPAAVRNYSAAAAVQLHPPRVIHPCAGAFGEVASWSAAVKPSRHRASDLGLFASVIGALADPNMTIGDLGLKPSGEVERFFTEDPADDLDAAARVMLGIKYLQMQATNRYVDGARRDLRLRQDAHVEQLRADLEDVVRPVAGLAYRVANLWDVLAELEAEPPPEGTVICLTPPWYKDGYTKQFQGAEAAFGWTAFEGREFNPEDLPELLERSAAVPGLRVFANLKSELGELVPDGYTPVCAYANADHSGAIDRLYVSGDADELLRYAPNRIVELKPRPVKLWTDTHELTAESKLEVVPLDRDTAIYVRDLYVHRLGSSFANLYYGLMLDGHLVTVFGIFSSGVLGASKRGDEYLGEQFGISSASRKYSRFNRLAAAAITCGDTKAMMLDDWPALQSRDVRGIQSTDIRPQPNSKVRRGAYKVVKTERQPDGQFKVVSRGPFREDTWEQVYAKWWATHSPEAIERRRLREQEAAAA